MHSDGGKLREVASNHPWSRQCLSCMMTSARSRVPGDSLALEVICMCPQA